MLKNVYVQAALIAIVLTAGSYGIGALFGWLAAVNLLEAFAVATSYACTYLCVKQKRWNYPIGAVSTAAYALLFFQGGLLGSTVLNAWLSLQLIYGWFRWGKDEATRPVTRVTPKTVPLYLLATGGFFLGAYTIVTVLGGTMAALDVGILVLTILAQFLLDNKKIENWAVWVVVNVLAIYVYFSNGLFLVGAQYIFFLGNTVYGWLSWRKTMVSPAAEASETFDLWDDYGFTDVEVDRV